MTLVQNNPMYKLSMSSIELFHSNFLECLFHEDKAAFLKCFGIDMNILTPNLMDLLDIKRECYLGTIENTEKIAKKYITDILVGFRLEYKLKEEGKDNEYLFPLLIIENKIKSYPHKDQLINQANCLKKEETSNNKYYRNTEAIAIEKSTLSTDEKKQLLEFKTKLFLLSVFDVSDEIIGQSGFKLMRYCTYKSNLKELTEDCLIEKIHLFFMLDNDFQKYINDYCEMWKQLYSSLQFYPLEFSINSELCLSKPYKELEELRFLDIYRKYQASVFASLVEKELAEDGKINGCKLITGSGFSNKHAIVDISIELEEETESKEKRLISGVQVENDQFRVFFAGNRIRTQDKCIKSRIIPQIIITYWNELLGCEMKGNSNKIKGLDCCSYSDRKTGEITFIYKYVKIPCNEGQYPTIKQIILDGFGENSICIKKVLDKISANKDDIVQALSQQYVKRL